MQRTPQIKFVRFADLMRYIYNTIREAQMWLKRFKSENYSVKDEVRPGPSQIKSVPSLRKWSKIDIFVATTLLKNWIIK